MTKEDLYALIERMGVVENVSESKDSISWKAHREAEQLTDASLLSVLQEIICEKSGKKDKRIRQEAYFIFGKILKSSFDYEACTFYIHRLTAETDKYLIHDILERLKDIELPTDIDIEPILLCSKSDKWLIRHSALEALGSSTTQKSREALLFYVNQDDEKQYKYEIIYANASLGKIGTESDIPILEKHIHSRIRDIKGTAQCAIKRIQERM